MRLNLNKEFILKFAAALVVSAGSLVSAQDSEPKDDDEEARPEVQEYVFVEGSLPYAPRSNTVVTKLPAELRLTPNNVGIVTAPLIDEQYGRVVSESLVNISNINIQTQNGIHDFFYVRGFDSLTSSLVMTDGASEPEATFYQLYNVDRVEVLKGPGGFLYGSNPLAGTINLVRKQPLPASFLDFGVVAGSYDNYEGSIDWNYGSADAPVSFRLNGLFRDQGSYRDGKDGRTAAINPSFAWRPNEATNVTVNIEYVAADFVPDSGLPVTRTDVAPVDRATSYQSPLDDSEQDIFRFQLDFERRISDTITIRDKVYHRNLNWISNGTIYNGVVPFGPTTFGVIRTFLELDDDQTFTGNQLEAVFSFATGSVEHELLTGFELARYADVFSLGVGALTPVDLLTPVDSGIAPMPIPNAGFAGDARSIVAAPYIVDQIGFGDKLHVLLGGRLDTIDFQDTATARERSDSEFSPMVGVLVAPTASVSVYGNYSRSFAPPSPRVTSELVPERSEQIEGGIKTRLDALRSDVTVAVYQLERDNIPIPDDTGFTQQTGNQRSRGVEVDVSVQPSSSSRAFVSYAFNRSELTNFRESVLVSIAPPTNVVFDRSGNRPAFAPEHIFNFWVSKDFSSSWGVGAGGRYVGDQFIAEDNVFQIDGVMTFDAMAFYRIANVRLSVNFKNLTDREYFLRGFGAQSVIPAPPFTAFFGVDVQM